MWRLAADAIMSECVFVAPHVRTAPPLRARPLTRAARPTLLRGGHHTRLEDAQWAPDAQVLLAALREQVFLGRTTPGAAADIIVHRFLRR